MAGDWIKMRADLRDDPSVARLADTFKLDELHIIGALFCFWAWADRHAVDGHVDGATSRLVDRVCGTAGFADALASVGWLVIGDAGVSIPKFERHNGESAKERSLKNARQARWRANKDANVDAAPSTAPSTNAPTREEKRRDKKPPTPLTGGFVAFWNAWPQHHRKAAKPQCAKKWERDGCEAFAAKVVAAVNAAKRSEAWMKNGGEFIPAPLVWLNQARWEAPPQEPPSNTVPSNEPDKTAELLAKMAADDAAAQSPEAKAARMAVMAKLGRIGRVAA